MAYPTTIAFHEAYPQLGLQPLMSTSTTKAHPLGTIVQGVDSVYGQGEFIYLEGVASTAAGDAVVYDSAAGTTTRTVAASKGPVAIAMSANVASQYGWYQISGAGVVNSSGATSGSVCGTSSTAGQLGNTTTAQQIEGMKFTTAQDGPGSGFTGVQLSRPSANLLG